MDDRALSVVRWGGLLLALFFTVPGVLNPEKWVFLNNVNLIFHEAGHMILMFLGETIMLMGGSLFQVLIPGACAAFFWVRGDRYAAGILLLWAAQSLANVSVYVADAPTRNLDLITGDPDTHDWWQLFSQWGNLNAAVSVGKFIHFLSLVTMLAGVVVAVWDDVNGSKTVSGE